MKKLYAAGLTMLMSACAFAAAEYDAVVYGGSSAGAVAAMQLAGMGKKVVLVEPSKQIGGLTVSGLGFTDAGRKDVIGGLAREFYRGVKKHYDDPAVWNYTSQSSYGLYRKEDDAMWTFEPKAAEKVLSDMLKGASVEVVTGERLDRKNGVEKEGLRIRSISMESGRRFAAKMFIDATYEGDLMALAGVSFTVGREANSQYGETINGVQAGNDRYHNFTAKVDPYVRRGDKSSGLLPGVEAAPNQPDGSADKRIQAYNFRLCLTNIKGNRIPFAKPDGYNEQDYELLLRYCEAGFDKLPLTFSMMPNSKTDSNNSLAFSSDFIGANYNYPEAGYAEREAIVAAHRKYLSGLLWTLANHPRVNAKIRNVFREWGLAKDEFPDNGAWPYMLYIREARRMVSDYVICEADCTLARAANDSVGMASYPMDSHHVRRYVAPDGSVRNEGDVQRACGGPYPVSYRSIIPRKGECENLLVPVCVSASHIAYGSIRMEPVFMILGQSAATAAAIAIDRNIAVQAVPYAELSARLKADRQILYYSVEDAVKLEKGVVVDDTMAQVVGEWTPSAATEPFIGRGYLTDGNTGKAGKKVIFRTKLTPGRYRVNVCFAPGANRASNVPVTVRSAKGERTVTVNQKEFGARWRSVGRYEFKEDAEVVISAAGTDGYVIVDAVQFLPM